MVKSVQAEPRLESLLQNLVFKQAVKARVGLLIGKKAVRSRDLLFHIIRTPQQEGIDVIQVSATASTSKGKKPSAAGASASSTITLKLDMPWIQEHADQVARSLPGGLSILGLFIICPEGGLASALEVIKSGPGPLLLHVDSASGKMTMKWSDGGSFKPCDLKFSSSMNSIIRLSCTHTLNMTLNVEALNETTAIGNKSFHDVIGNALKTESDRIDASIALSCRHQLIPIDPPLIDVLGNEPAAASGSVSNHEILLACAAFPTGSAADIKSSATEGVGNLSGAISGVTFIHNRESMGKAISELKLDLQKSLMTRLELMVEDALSFQEESAPASEQFVNEDCSKERGQGKESKSHPLLEKRVQGQRWTRRSFLLPARVEIPLNVNGTVLALTDYVMSNEEMSDVASRAKELFDLDMEESSIVVMEEREASSRLKASNTRLATGLAAGTSVHDATSRFHPSPAVNSSTKGEPIAIKLLCFALLALVLALVLKYKHI